ncbi:MAG TPA: class I SAM-dependent methyltransferase, partial [Treponema sp.]|nr:class I SAM-dependent methyltransferase [Treponema sp.]
MKQKQPVKTWSTPVSAEKERKIPCALCGGLVFSQALRCEGFVYVRCKRCGLTQRNPQPEAADVLRRYAQTYGGDYLGYELANEESFLRLQLCALRDTGFEGLEKELFAGMAAAPPRVLDIGCATGALLERLKERGWRVCGVEISPSGEYARAERGLEVSSLPLEENCFSEGSFDVILASHLIEHLNAPAPFVGEVYRLLKPGGHFFVTTPNIAGFQARLFAGCWRSAIFDHLYLFSVRTLAAMLESAGFVIECVRTWGGLAEGAAPRWLKKIADRMVKPLGAGDVMIVRA